MKMIEHMQQYYQGERNTAYIAVAIGIILIGISFILVQYFANERLVKGLFYVFLGGSLFFLTAGISVAIYNTRKIEEVKSETLNNKELQKSETERMKLVMTKGYCFALILFTTLVIGGVALSVFNPNDLWKGIGLGLLIIGVTGHTTEAFSMQKNKVYQQKINSLNF